MLNHLNNADIANSLLILPIHYSQNMRVTISLLSLRLAAEENNITVESNKWGLIFEMSGNDK